LDITCLVMGVLGVNDIEVGLTEISKFFGSRETLVKKLYYAPRLFGI